MDAPITRAKTSRSDGKPGKYALWNKLPRLGPLYMVHEFLALGNDPILFVCVDAGNRYYLCSCCHLSDEWLVGLVDAKALSDVAAGKIGVRETFERCRKRFFFTWNGNRFWAHHTIPKDAFPMSNLFVRDISPNAPWLDPRPSAGG